MKKGLFYLAAILAMVSLQSCEEKMEKELKFLTFNVWQEGTSVSNGLQKIRDVILETNPDVVCFVEVRNYKNQDWTTKMVNALAETGKQYYRGYAGGDVSFISKYPLDNGKLIFSNSDKGTVVNFNINVDGNVIVVSGAHLDYTYYASNLPRGYNGGNPNWEMMDDGKGIPLPMIILDSVQSYSLKSKRDEAILAFIASLNTEIKPIILMGDFNEPSWLDWTEKTKNMFNHNGLIIPWFSTRKLHEEGFSDAYRTFFPNEKLNPGFTWPSYANGKESTSWTPKSDERDRLDYIFFKGNGLKLKNVVLVGPKELYAYNKLDDSNISKEKFIASKLAWPSDHRAVLAKFSFTLNK